MRERAVTIGRLVFGVLAAVALGTQAYHSATRNGSMVNFFGYFTNLSNIAAMLVLLAGAVLGLLGRPGVPDPLRGAVVLYMTVTGVIYAVLLSGYHLPLALPWVNVVVHKVMPVVVLADWWLVPATRRLDWRHVTSWLAFPLLYLFYSLLRGHVVDWYPYPFLDPTRRGGYGRVAGACALITLLFVAVALGIVRIGNRLAPRGRHRQAVHT
ncbi:Pr6Pr family membrane protein [Kitasatospora sp. NPDC048365]|uniref:Pr6Pr family membrane protein n=1 Tax=Kitasatospora sp. NPDC048365 TaxID=3364050 RepID=UPI003714516C